MSYEFKVIISDEEYKAFRIIVGNPDEWVSGMILNKVRQCLIRLVESVAEYPDKFLSFIDQQLILQAMQVSGDLLKSPKTYSDEIKKLIASKFIEKGQAKSEE